MTSVRAESVAEVLWELKTLGRLAIYSEIAVRAGFRPGPEGRFVAQAIIAIRRDWPHLQWWRAVPDNTQFVVSSDHYNELQMAGVALAEVNGKTELVTLSEPENQLHHWPVVAKVVPPRPVSIAANSVIRSTNTSTDDSDDADADELPAGTSAATK